ncbi:MAG: hypothetical protein K5796_00810 [Lachnospiraceae bacterium]|nr:hypothetical protein [Lachnospiraceae bacterium]
MVNTDRIYWELLNNEIRKVSVDKSAQQTVISTRFRTIQNEMRFTGVTWSDNLELMTGCLLNYVQEITAETFTGAVKERFEKLFNGDFSLENLKDEGRVLFKIVCDRNQIEFFIIAAKLSICINE